MKMAKFEHYSSYNEQVIMDAGVTSCASLISGLFVPLMTFACARMTIKVRPLDHVNVLLTG